MNLFLFRGMYGEKLIFSKFSIVSSFYLFVPFMEAINGVVPPGGGFITDGFFANCGCGYFLPGIGE